MEFENFQFTIRWKFRFNSSSWINCKGKHKLYEMDIVTCAGIWWSRCVAPCCRGRAPIYGASGWAYCTVTRLSTCSAIPWTSLSSTATRNETCHWGWYSTSPNSPIWGKLTLSSFLSCSKKKKLLYMDDYYSWNNIERVELLSHESKYCLKYCKKTKLYESQNEMVI